MSVPTFQASLPFAHRAHAPYLCRDAVNVRSGVSLLRMARGRRSRVRRNNKRGEGHSSRATQRAGEQHLVDQFEEQVGTPLEQRSSDAAKRSVAGDRGDRADDGNRDKNKKRLMSLQLPARTQTLNLLVRGAWVGIGILAGVFVLVHFVIVKDLLPK